MSDSKENIINQLDQIYKEISEYFDKCTYALGDIAKENFCSDTPEYYWALIPDDLKQEADKLTEKLVLAGQRIALICKNSLLVDDPYLNEIRVSIKKMRSVIRLKQFYFSETQVVHDEGVVFGIQPASQRESNPIKPETSNFIYKKSNDHLIRILQLADEFGTSSGVNLFQQDSQTHKYKPNTAFIMMWMDSTQPELEDIRDTVCSTFDKFGIKAIRADDIEHEGIITQRILDEVKTSEFLFADLTGARPNVYYEVGYAHALGKRVILYRKKGTGLHFDLAGYNCPEYNNLRDLKGKLSKRLENLTNKQVAD